MTGDAVLTARFWKAAGIRALRTFAQTLAVLWGSDGAQLISGTTLEWVGASAAAAVLSVLTSIVAGIPEVEQPSGESA